MYPCAHLTRNATCTLAARWDELMKDIEGGMFGDKDYFKPLVDSVNNMKASTRGAGQAQEDG